jgi:predicted peptidase
MVKPILKVVAACAVAVGLSSLVGCNGARDTAVRMGETSNHRGFIRKTLPNGREYAVFLPLNYTPDRKWPAIMFLHGMGEGGSDITAPMKVGLAPFVADRASSFPFIVIIPQSPNGSWDPDSDAAKDAIAALMKTEKEYSVDPDRVALTGLSTGGYGTFAIGARYSNLFAALAPMCPSGGCTNEGATLAKMNIWAVENGADPFVAPLSMASTLGSIHDAGGNPKHTVYANFGHDCWERAYGDGEIFAWLLQQRRGKISAAPTKSESSKSSKSSAAPEATPVASHAAVTPVSSASSQQIPETPY